MLLKILALIIFGILFPFGVQCKNNEIVGLSGIAKLRAIAAKARLDQELELHRLRTHLPHHLLLAPNPSESLNSSETISTELTPSKSTSLYLLVTTQIPTKYFDRSDHTTTFQSKSTELPVLKTSESVSFAINNSESFPEFQLTSISTNSNDEATTIYAQYDEETKFVKLQESTSHNPNDLVMQFRNDTFTHISNNATKTSIMDQMVDISTAKASLHRNAYVDDEGQNDNYASPELKSNSSYNSNLFAMQKENSSISFHDSDHITKSRIENDNFKQNFSYLTDIRKLPSYLLTIKPNSSPNNSTVIKPNEDMSAFKNTGKEQLTSKTVNIDHHRQIIPIVQNKFHEIDKSARNSFKSKTPKLDQNVFNFNKDMSMQNNSQKEQFTPNSANIKNSPFTENKFHEGGNLFIQSNFELNRNLHNFKKPNEDLSENIKKGQFIPKPINFGNLQHHHPQEMSFVQKEIHDTDNSFSRSNFESETPMQNQNQKPHYPINEDILQRRQYLSRDKQDQELFLQYLNMIQSQNNQGILRTADDIDPSYNNQYIPNSPQITFYPIDWKTNEVRGSLVQQYELSPIQYQISRESAEEVIDKPMAEKFHRLNEKMRNFQLGNYGDENSARAANPSDPRHFHSHSLEIHHTKHVRPSTYHSSFNKHKEVSSKFHSTNFSFQKNHWKESPAIPEQTDYISSDKHHRKDLSAFSHTEKYPSANNFQSSSKSLDKQHWEDPSFFGHAENLPSSNNFHSSKSLDKQHSEDLSAFGHTKNLHSPTHWQDLSAFGHAENLPSSGKFLDTQHHIFDHVEKLPSLTNFHSSSKSLDKQHSGEVPHSAVSTPPFEHVENLPSSGKFLDTQHHIFDRVENLPSSTNFHSSSKSLDKQHSGQVAHSAVLTPPSHITVNNQNNFISTDSVNGNQHIEIAQSNGGQSHQSPRGDQPFDRSELGSPYLFQFPRNAENRRFKRSLPLIKLFTDPNVQLDVPKTLENVGTVARNSFEDRRAPMFHVRNMLGSAKNTVMSTLKIPPQNAIVPSRYKIVDKETTEWGNNFLGKVKDGGDGLLKETNENYLGNEIMKTFYKVGNVVRESVKSGQETLQHVGDVFHNAKKAVSATRYSTPRLLRPYTRTPVLKRNKPEKIMLITPRFADITQEDQLIGVGAVQNDDFVKLGDIMDAVGVSNPERKDTGISRLVIQPRKSIVSSKKPNLNKKLMLSKRPALQSRFGADESDLGQVENAKKTEYFILREDVERNELDEISDTLANIKNMVGNKTMRDFLTYMKQKFLLEHLKDKLRRVEQGAELNENVGSGLALSNDLMKPFMGRPTKTELTNYFRKNGDSIEEDEGNYGIQSSAVSAINPQVYQNYFNETLKVNDKVKSLTEGALPQIANLNDEKVGDCFDGVSEEAMVDMKVPKKLKKPFMGKKVRKDSKYFY